MGRDVAFESSSSIKESPRVFRRGGFVFQRPYLEGADVRGARSLLGLLDVELDGLVLGEGLEARRHDAGVVDEQVATRLGRDEAETLGVVEPLDSALSHLER